MDYFYEVAMLDMIDADLIVNFSIMLTLMSVATGLYYEIETIIRFMSKTTGRSGFLVTRIYRPAVRWYYGFFLITLFASLICYFFYSESHWVFVGFAALLIAFSLYGLLFQVCFVNPVGLGQVSRKLEMEFQWDEIMSYRWDDNVLHLIMKQKPYMKPRFRFYDTDVMIAVNEHLAQVRDFGAQKVID